MPDLSGLIFSDPLAEEREDAQEAAWSIVYRSDPHFVPRRLSVNGDDMLIELGPRMTRVFNQYLDPNEALEICGDYGRLMDVEYVGEETTLVVRVLCEPEELPFPQAITLGTLPAKWENECGEYGRVDFEGGDYLPVRGYRIKTTSLEDKSAICANRLVRSRVTQAAPVEIGLIPQPNLSAAVPVAVSQQPQATPEGGTVAYPLQVGRLTVHGADWKFITFVGHQVRLSPQIKKVIKTMYELGVKSRGEAKTSQEILMAAGIRHDDGARSLSNVFSSGGNHKKKFKEVFEKCICKTDERPPRYHLT